MSELVLRLGPSVAMYIFVVTLNGTTYTLQVKRSVTIGKVKTKLEEINGTPADQQAMIFQGKSLEDSWTIAECHIKHESTIHMMLHQCGC
ncbi:unnamed protein product [Brassica oleracea]